MFKMKKSIVNECVFIKMKKNLSIDKFQLYSYKFIVVACGDPHAYICNDNIFIKNKCIYLYLKLILYRYFNAYNSAYYSILIIFVIVSCTLTKFISYGVYTKIRHLLFQFEKNYRNK